MFTANSMNCLMEVLGMTVPGNGTIVATSEERHELIRQAARYLVELVKKISARVTLLLERQLIMPLP